MKGEWVTIVTRDGHDENVFIPDRRIRESCATYLYRPCRGYSASVAVENIHEHIIGWMHVDDLPGGPYPDVKAWMERTQYTSVATKEPMVTDDTSIEGG